MLSYLLFQSRNHLQNSGLKLFSQNRIIGKIYNEISCILLTENFKNCLISTLNSINLIKL